MNTNKRNYFYDYIKGFLICCVVFGHAIQLFNGKVYRDETSYYYNMVYKFIYSFHMPCFMLISGMLYNYSIKKNSSIQFYLKKIMAYYIPIMSFTVIKCIIKKETSLYLIVSELFHTLWYLYSMIFAVSFIFICTKLRSKWQIYLIYIIAILGIFLTPDILMSSMYKFVIPYFVIGYYIKEKNLECKLMNNKWWVVCFPIWIAGVLLFYNKNMYIYISGIALNIYSRNYSEIIQQCQIDIFRYIIGMMGCISILNLLKLIWNNLQNENNFLVLLGSETLAIYIFSTEVFNELLYSSTMLCTFSWLRTTVLSIGLTYLCLFVGLGLKKIHPLNYLLLGRK